MASLQCTNVPQPPAIITFFGIPGSGKTVVAKKLADDLQAQYIQQDGMRFILHNKGVKTGNVAPITLAVVGKILAKHPNKRIMLDASIDRSWPKFYENCKKWGIKPITIRLNADAKTAVKNLTDRGRYDDETLLRSLTHYIEQFEQAKKDMPADITASWPYDYDHIITAIKAKL